MPFEEFKAAFVQADADAIVKELSTWTEAQRKKAAKPLNELIEGMESPNSDLRDQLDALEEEIRAAAGSSDFAEQMQTFMEHAAQIGGLQNRRPALEMRNMKELAKLGVGALSDVGRFNHQILCRDPEHAFQILLDRRPKWLGRWLQGGYRKNVEGIPLDTWLKLVRAGLVEWDDENEMLAVHVAGKLPGLIEEDPATAEELMEHVPEVRDIIYRVPELDMFTMYDLWSPLIQKWNEAGKLDRVRFIRSLMIGLNMNFKKNHRQDSIGLAVLTKPSADEWSEVQADLIGLLNHAEPIVVSFAITQLNVIDREATLDREAVIPGLANAFELKHKTHIVGAVNLLDRIAENADLRTQAVLTATAGLSHANADVRDWVMQLLVKHMQPEDDETINRLTQDEPTFAASVKPKLRELLEHLVASAEDELEESEVSFDFDSFRQAVAEIPETARNLVCLDEAIEAAQQGRIDSRCDWPIMSGKVLVNTEAVKPIESLEQLIDTVMAAIEQLESPDELPRILDAIARFADQKPDDFAKRTAALKNRIVETAGDPPYRGLLFGQYGGAITRLLLLWLIDKENKAERDYALEYVGSTFIVKDCILQVMNHIAQHALAHKSCLLLSTPTHAGGWIDPRVWVARLLQLQKSDDDCNSTDFAKSALRLAPDERSAQLSKLSELEQPYRDLATCALGGEIDFRQAEGDPVLWIAACRAR